MTANRSDYGTSLLNVTEENNRDASETHFVLSCGVEMSMESDKDGNNFWSSKIEDVGGASMEFNAPTYFSAIEKMYYYLKFGTR